MTRRQVVGVFFLAIFILSAGVAVWLFAQAINFNESRLSPYVPEKNQITLPEIGVLLNGTQTTLQPDISISITLTYNGTLVAEETPVNLSAIAFPHVPNGDKITVFLTFQDSLKYPSVPAQVFKADGITALHYDPKSGYLEGSQMVYFPLEGSFQPIVWVLVNETQRNGPTVVSSSLPQVIKAVALDVQPTTRLADEQTARDNLQLEFDADIIGIIGLLAVVAATFREVVNYLFRRVTPP